MLLQNAEVRIQINQVHSGAQRPDEHRSARLEHAVDSHAGQNVFLRTVDTVPENQPLPAELRTDAEAPAGDKHHKNAEEVFEDLLQLYPRDVRASRAAGGLRRILPVLPGQNPELGG